MKDKCYECYWYGGDHDMCAQGYKLDFDCERDFCRIDEKLYDWLIESCEIPKDVLVQDGNYWNWVRSGGKTNAND